MQKIKDLKATVFIKDDGDFRTVIDIFNKPDRNGDLLGVVAASKKSKSDPYVGTFSKEELVEIRDAINETLENN